MDSTSVILPQEVLAAKLIPVATVAALVDLNPEYFVKCIRASSNEAFRLNQQISRHTIDSLPLHAWFKRGNRWYIRQDDLADQFS